MEESKPKKMKNVKLTEDVIKALNIQAAIAGFNNVQNYMEHILIEKSKEK